MCEMPALTVGFQIQTAPLHVASGSSRGYPLTEKVKGKFFWVIQAFTCWFECVFLDLIKITAISMIFLRSRSDLIKFWEEVVNANASYLYGFALKSFNLQHE